MTISDKQFVHLRGTGWSGFNTNVPTSTWTCGYCDNQVASALGAASHGTAAGTYYIRICTYCGGPTFFLVDGTYSPAPKPGSAVENLPSELGELYEEARRAAGAGAHTAAVLVCRKMLMNIAVAEGAQPGKTFIDYVTYLADKGFVPPRGQGWVDYIRQRGNEATHEIELMSGVDSTALITYVEMLLRFIYEFPARVPPTPSAAAPTAP